MKVKSSKTIGIKYLQLEKGVRVLQWFGGQLAVCIYWLDHIFRWHANKKALRILLLLSA